MTRRYGLVIIVAMLILSSCLGETLERQAEQLRQQNEELVKQRQDIEALKAGKQVQDQKQQDCSRAFRDYFDRAQTSTDPEQTIALYRDGLALCPDDEVARYELGRVLADRGRNAEAEREYEAAIKINPGFGDARRQLELLRKR